MTSKKTNYLDLIDKYKQLDFYDFNFKFTHYGYLNYKVIIPATKQSSNIEKYIDILFNTNTRVSFATYNVSLKEMNPLEKTYKIPLILNYKLQFLPNDSIKLITQDEFKQFFKKHALFFLHDKLDYRTNKLSSKDVLQVLYMARHFDAFDILNDAIDKADQNLLHKNFYKQGIDYVMLKPKRSKEDIQIIENFIKDNEFKTIKAEKYLMIHEKIDLFKQVKFHDNVLDYYKFYEKLKYCNKDFPQYKTYLDIFAEVYPNELYDSIVRCYQKREAYERVELFEFLLDKCKSKNILEIITNNTKDKELLIKVINTYNLDDLVKECEVNNLNKELSNKLTIYNQLNKNNDITKINELYITAKEIKKYEQYNLDKLNIYYNENKLDLKQMVFILNELSYLGKLQLYSQLELILNNLSSKNTKNDVSKLLNGFINQGCRAQQRKVLILIGCILDDSSFEIYESFNINEMQAAVKIDYIDALTFSNTNKALNYLFLKKYLSRDKVISKTASNALAKFMDVNSISYLDLYLKVDLTLGFKDNKLDFKCGETDLVLRLDNKCNVQVYKNGELLKKFITCKTIMEKQDKVKFEELKKSIKNIQKIIEYFLYSSIVSQYEITKIDFERIILTNPLARSVLSKFIYKDNDVLFTIDESNDVITLDYDNYEITGTVQIVNQFDLSIEQLKLIEEYMLDNKINNDLYKLDDIVNYRQLNNHEYIVNYIKFNKLMQKLGLMRYTEGYKTAAKSGEINIYCDFSYLNLSYDIAFRNISNKSENFASNQFVENEIFKILR